MRPQMQPVVVVERVEEERTAGITRSRVDPERARQQPRAAGGRNRDTMEPNHGATASSRSVTFSLSLVMSICAYLIIAPEGARGVVNGEEQVGIASVFGGAIAEPYRRMPF